MNRLITFNEVMRRGRRAWKPRARWNNCGIGYWTVRNTAMDGFVYQGVGKTLPEAYSAWLEVHSQHP